MINEPDVTGKTPVDYATEGKTPRYCSVEREVVYLYQEKIVLIREHSFVENIQPIFLRGSSYTYLHKEIQYLVIRCTIRFFVI